MELGGMSSRGTVHRTFRCEDDIWLPAKAAAEERGENLSDVIREALRRYIETVDPLGPDPSN